MVHRCSLIIVFPVFPWKLVNTILRQQHTPYNYHIPGVSPGISKYCKYFNSLYNSNLSTKVSSKSTKEPIHHILVQPDYIEYFTISLKNHSYKFILRSTPRMVPNKKKDEWSSISLSFGHLGGHTLFSTTPISTVNHCEQSHKMSKILPKKYPKRII